MTAGLLESMDLVVNLRRTIGRAFGGSGGLPARHDLRGLSHSRLDSGLGFLNERPLGGGVLVRLCLAILVVNHGSHLLPSCVGARPYRNNLAMPHIPERSQVRRTIRSSSRSTTTVPPDSSLPNRSSSVSGRLI